MTFTVGLRTELVERAHAQSGLTDLGPDGWQEGLDHLLHALGSDLAGAQEIVDRLQAVFLKRLVDRMRIERWLVEHADEQQTPVSGPVVIVGLPRTATTALQHLLAVDPQFRYQRRWELGDPVPPVSTASEANDARRQQAIDAGITPSVQHISAVDGPIEEGPILGLHFHNQELGSPIPTYTRWWRTADAATTYAYHERILRMLHSRRGPCRWLLKAPAFLFHVAPLAAQYPGVRFLVTHRDPVAAMPSACSVVQTVQSMSVPNGALPKHRLGTFMMEHWVEGLRQFEEDRQTVGHERFLDVAQRDLQDEGIRLVERIFEFLGLELKSSVRANMASWIEENRPGARGEHVYTAQEYGLTDEEIRSAFAGYLQRYESFVTA